MTLTRKQREARARNWMIFRLRSAANLFRQLGNAQGVAAAEAEIKKLKEHDNART